MDPRCIITAPDDSNDGEWYRADDSWMNECDDNTCTLMCYANGVAFQSDAGGQVMEDGVVVPCIRHTCTGNNWNLVNTILQ